MFRSKSDFLEIKFRQIFKVLFLIIAILYPNAILISAPIAPLATFLGEQGLTINHSFTGSSLLIFGSKPPSQDLAIVVTGPKGDYLLNTKKKIIGLWIGRSSTKIRNALSYHAVWATKNLFDNSDVLNLREIDPLNGISQTPELQAFAREMEISKGLYFPLQLIEVGRNNLFNLSINLPKNLKVGNYTIKVFSFQDLVPREKVIMNFEVRHSNFNGLLSELNKNYPKTYLILLLFVSALNVLILKTFLG